jgi:hypothetical protein
MRRGQEELKKSRERYQKYKKRFEQLRDLLDPEKRPETVMDLALEWLPKALDRVLGLEKPMSVGIYLKFYEAHFKVLRECVGVAASRDVIDQRRGRILAQLRELVRDGERLTREFGRGGERWLHLRNCLARRQYWELLYRNTLDYYGRVPPGLDLEGPLGQQQEQLDELFNELLTRYAAIRVAADELGRLAQEREAKLDRLQQRSTLGYIAAETARRDDNLEDVFRGTPEKQAQRVVHQIEKVIEDWASDLDRAHPN